MSKGSYSTSLPREFPDTDGELARLRQMFEQAPGFVCMLRGADHVFELVNPAFSQLIGHRNVLGLPIRQALPEIAGQGFFEQLDRVYASGIAYSGNAVALMVQHSADAPAERRYLDFVYQPVKGPTGEAFGVFVQGSDVTDRVEAQSRERRSEVRNRQILDSAVDFAIIAFDLQGRITRWNEGARRIFGWTEAEMLSQDRNRIFTAEDRARDQAGVEMREALERGAGRDDRWHVRKSGEAFWASGEMTPLVEADGVVSGFVKVLRDQTEQHRAAEALKESENRLRRAQRAGGVGTFTVDVATDVISGTEEFFRLFGLAPKPQASTSEFEALVIAQDADVPSSSASRRANLVPLDVEYRIRRADDGRVRWLSRKAEFEYDKEGRPLRMAGVVQDITEQKAAMLALQRSEALFRSFAQTLPNHVWTSPPTGQLDWFNDRVYEYSGTRVGDLDGNRWTQIVHPDDLADAATSWSTALATGAPYETEFRIRRTDGQFRWHLVRGLPLQDPDGQIGRWVGTNTDIHDRRLAEAERIREAAQDRERVWNATNDLIGTATPEGTLRAVNPAWQRLLGYEPGELLARPLQDFVEEADRPRLTAALASASQSGDRRELELRMQQRDGRLALFEWALENVQDIVYLFGHNVTEQRMAEEALRQAQKMEAVGQLTGGIAHDFNNLLQAIIGSLGLVRKLIEHQRYSEVARFVDGAMSSAHRAASLTHRLLAFSRRQALDPRTMDVNPLVASMEELVRRTVGERIRVVLDKTPDLWLTRCDPNQLENALLNLVINARDAMPEGGVLAIESSNVRLEQPFAGGREHLQPGDYVCVAVTDTGAGMSADTLAKAFEPFFTTKPIGQGTGLGLSMIYGFARQSGGDVKLYSEVGKGTTVRLYLPRARGADEPVEPVVAATGLLAAPAGTETIVVVEDELVVRNLIVHALRDAGYQVLEAEDGPSGLRVLQATPQAQLLITDVGLPGLNGRQLAEAARSLSGSLRVMFMTGYAENLTMSPADLLPGMTMMSKPFLLEVLMERVRIILDDTAPC